LVVLLNKYYEETLCIAVKAEYTDAVDEIVESMYSFELKILFEFLVDRLYLLE